MSETIRIVDPTRDNHNGETGTNGNLAPLPSEAMPNPARALAAGSWLDRYCEYGDAISPMTPRPFHESAGLFLASVAVARRLKVPMFYGDVFPNLFVVWIAYTTLYRKSTALAVAQKQARQVFPHLMAAQDTTPEAFLSDLAGREPPHLDALTEADRDDWTLGRHYAAQRGWMLDEMSGLMAGAGRDYNAGLVESLLRFYDCEPYYVRSTRGQGRVVVRDSYLSLLGASTPAAMAPHLLSERLWAMGWWPRFAILTPTNERPAWRVAKDQDPPEALAQGLRRIYSRLPEATWPKTPTALSVQLGTDVYPSWERYNRAVSYDLLTDDLDHRLHGTYGRLPTNALKVATLLAAMDWPETKTAPTIELPHMARAILICEDWRASAHRALATVTQTEFDRIRVRILQQIAKAQPDGPTLRDLCRAMGDKTPGEIEETLLQMTRTNEVEGYQTTGRGRPTTRYRMITE